MPKTCIRRLLSSPSSAALRVLAALLLTTATAHADSVAYSCHPKEHPDVKFTIHGGCTGFDAKDEHGVSGHVDFGLPVSGDMLVSDDGRHVVAVQSYFYGLVSKDGSIVDYSAKGETVQKSDPVALLIYRDRHFLASYRFSEILLRPTMVEQSVSHFQWLRNLSGFDESCGRKLILDTTSFRHLEFDLDSGKLEKQQDASEWSECDVIARSSSDQKTLASILKGKVTPPAHFDNPRRLQIDFDDAVCLKRTASGLTAISTLPMRWEPWLVKPAQQCHY